MENYYHQYVLNQFVFKKKIYGLSDDKPLWPRMFALQKINYKPTPEWKFTVEREDGETAQVMQKIFIN